MIRLNYGDNREILHKEIKDVSIDLIYLDPPFNSKRDYNLLFKTPHHGAFPKLQILTIEGLLSGKERAQYPDMAMGGQTFKHAKKEEGAQQQKGLF